MTASPPRYFSYIYVSYQMYVTWSCVTFYHYKIDFQKQMTTVLVLPENIFNIEVYSRSTYFHFKLNLKLNFLDFYEKNPCKKKKVRINYFDEQEKPWIFFKIFQKKNKNFKAICVVLDYSKTSPPPTILVLLRPCKWRLKIFQTSLLNS